MFISITNRRYTHIITSPKIALSKKLTSSILDQSFITNCFGLLAIDEIHLVKEWGKNFLPIYAEIEKVKNKSFVTIFYLESRPH